MGKKPARLEAPLLREYLAGLPAYPRHAPQIPGWAPWLLSVATIALMWHWLNIFGIAAVFILCFVVLPWAVRQVWKPQTEAQRADAAFLDAVRPVKPYVTDGSIRRRFPPDVLIALERAVAMRAQVGAQLHANSLYGAEPDAAPAERYMRAALLAAMPVFRTDARSRKEWQAILDNRALTGPIVDTITSLEARMGESLPSDTARLAALRELDAMDLPELRVSE